MGTFSVRSKGNLIPALECAYTAVNEGGFYARSKVAVNLWSSCVLALSWDDFTQAEIDRSKWCKSVP